LRDAGFCIINPPIQSRNSFMEEPKMLDLYTRFMAWLQSEEGQGLAEYALILVLIAVVVIAAVTLLGTGISQTFSRIATSL
jgi:pilus assembly protein Flp/PilA